jgi:steroid delta-isomerase-like uncharacterized protein
MHPSASGQGEGPLGAAENLAMHKEWTTAEDQQNLTRHHQFMHDDIVVNQAGVDPVVGLDGYITMMEETYAGLPDFHVVLEDEFATDDRVVCRWRLSGTHEGDLFGIPATGKQIDYMGVSLWEFDGGKARRGWIFTDVASLMAQLGMA